MKVLITGANGQLGRGLRKSMPQGVDCTAFGRSELDITDAVAVTKAVTHYKPDWIINAAAHTAVDRAEEEPDLAFAVNRDGVAHLAVAARDAGARILHVSTDYVFNGQGCRPYRPSDPVDPINVYGQSKREGEIRLAEILPDVHALVRTSWLYDLPGRNFVSTMLKLMQERPEVRVVCDQVGSPTAVSGLAQAIWRIVERELSGVYHWSDAGVASWYDFAVAIQREGETRAMQVSRCKIVPVLTREFPTAASRPVFSALDFVECARVLNLEPVSWGNGLSSVLSSVPSDYWTELKGVQ